jgi:hypothetical protein
MKRYALLMLALLLVGGCSEELLARQYTAQGSPDATEEVVPERPDGFPCGPMYPPCQGPNGELVVNDDLLWDYKAGDWYYKAPWVEGMDWVLVEIIESGCNS